MSETTLAASNAANNYTLKNNEDGSFAIKKAAADVLTISSGGIITGSASATLVGNGPAFSASANAAQSVTSGAETKVTFGVEVFDTSGSFASSRFTAPIAGYYQLNARLRVQATSLTQVWIVLYKNGASLGNITNTFTSTAAWFVGISDLVYLAVGDYVEVWGGGVGTTPVFSSAANPNTSYFTGSLVRAA